jgi:PDZ domain-containing protein
MVNRIYKRLLTILKENYKFIMLLALFYITLSIPLPYYIHTKGGLIDVSQRVTITDEYEKSGSINLSYVTEMSGNVLTYLLSFIIPHWDLVSQEDYVASNESISDAEYRNHILLDEANDNATIVAYKAADRDITITNQHICVVYIAEEALTDLKIGDEIISVGHTKINNFQDYIDAVSLGREGEDLTIEVINKENNKVNRTAKLYKYNERLITGIVVATKYIYETEPSISFNFSENELGPSGGLMMALAIYNKLVNEDLTKGLTIVGTGTIDVDGNVGEISGIEYKLKGAVDAKADIFIAPLGTNYEEALTLVSKNNYDITVIGVATFNDTLNYLRGV